MTKAGRPELLSYATLGSTLVASFLIYSQYQGWQRFGWALILVSAMVATCAYVGLKLSDLGLSRSKLVPGLWLAIRVMGVILMGLLVVYWLRGQIFNDSRYSGNLAKALYTALVLVPLRTVLFEEFLFRGVVLGVVSKWRGQIVATVVSSLAFGLWHLSSAGNIGTYQLTSTIVIPVWLVTIVIVAATAAAGAGFCWLRWRSGSLIAPLLVHWFINAGAIILIAVRT